MPRLPIVCLSLLAAGFTLAARTQEAPTYDRIDLNASAERDVENDVLTAVVYAEVTSREQSEAADAVNESIGWAVSRVKNARDIEYQTSQYTTRPVYAENSRRIVSWVARQSMTLRSMDSEALGKLLGELQERVALGNVGYEVSKASRDAAEDELIAEAIARFEARAKLVAKQLDRPGYRLVHLNIINSGPPVIRRANLAFATDDFAPPAIEAGTQTVTVSVNGTIELEPAP